METMCVKYLLHLLRFASPPSGYCPFSLVEHTHLMPNRPYAQSLGTIKESPIGHVASIRMPMSPAARSSYRASHLTRGSTKSAFLPVFEFYFAVVSVSTLSCFVLCATVTVGLHLLFSGSHLEL